MRIDFHPSPEPTLGIEWEFALVDKESRDLVQLRGRTCSRRRSHGWPTPVGSTRRCCATPSRWSPGCAPPSATPSASWRRRCGWSTDAGDALGLDLFGAGAHPFADWSEQQLTPGHRYEELISRTQWWGRQMLIWGVHVHVGLPEQERVMPVLSALLTTYPHLQALSASSPVWAGTDTGYASNRALMFQQLPTAGLPFQFATWAEFEAFYGDQLTTGVIDGMSDIRWDVRPAPHLGTLENRVCDGVSTLAETRGARRARCTASSSTSTPGSPPARRCRRCRRGTCRRTSGGPPATGSTPS